MKVKEFRISLFEAGVLVFWDCGLKDVKKYLDKNFKSYPKTTALWLDENADNPPQGVCISDPQSANCLIWLSQSPKKRPELYAHEAAHAAFRMMRTWSIEIDENTQEVLAMLVGKLVANINLP